MTQSNEQPHLHDASNDGQALSVADAIIDDLASKNAVLTKENSFLRVAVQQRDHQIEHLQEQLRNAQQIEVPSADSADENPRKKQRTAG